MLWDHCNPAALCYLFTNTLIYIADCIENEKQQKYVPISGAMIFESDNRRKGYVARNWKNSLDLFYEPLTMFNIADMCSSV